MRALVALPLLLAACAPSPVATQTMLEERGVLRPVVSEGDWLFGPCGWSEPFVARFSGRFEGRLVTGLVCATDERAEDARLVDVRQPLPGRER